MTQDHCIHCPYCDVHLCLRSEMEETEGGLPKKGTVALCAACEKICIVGDDGEHLRPTHAQIEDMRANPALCRVIAETVVSLRLMKQQQGVMPMAAVQDAPRPTLH